MKPVHWSQLRHMRESPATYLHHLTDPITATTAMRFGSLVHALVLGKAPRSFVVFDKPRRGNAWKDFKGSHDGLEIVTADEWERASNAADAVKTDAVCGPLLKQGVRESTIEWEVAGRTCAGTPDLNGGILVDLKVTPMLNPLKFPWHARKMGWAIQAVWYLDGLEATGETVSDAYLIAVDPKPPHLCVAYYLTERTIELGRKSWRTLFEKLLVCEKSNEWPGYAQSFVPLDLDDEEFELTIQGEAVEM